MARSSERIRLAAVEKKKWQVEATKQKKEEERKMKLKKEEERKNKKKQNEVKTKGVRKVAAKTKTKKALKQYEVSGIIDVRHVGGYKQYLVAWVGYARPTWTNAENLINCDEALSAFRRRALGKRKSPTAPPRPSSQRRVRTPRPDTPRATPRPDTLPPAEPAKDPLEDDDLLKECEKFFGSHCLYRALKVDRDAGDYEIRKAYRARCLLFHTDKNGAPGAEERFKAIKSAYDVLSDPSRKQIYDEEGRVMKKLLSLD